MLEGRRRGEEGKKSTYASVGAVADAVGLAGDVSWVAPHEDYADDWGGGMWVGGSALGSRGGFPEELKRQAGEAEAYYVHRAP